ncbi:MAG: hypothetical protein ACLFVS_07600, partial [Candidatus Acetothermia bacterium]
FGSDVEPGDLLFIEIADPSTINKIGTDDKNVLFGVAHEEVSSGESGMVELPMGAVYEVNMAGSSDWEGDPGGPSKLVHPYGQTLCRVSAGGPAAGTIVGQDVEMGGTGKVALFGGGIDGVGAILGEVPAI